MTSKKRWVIGLTGGIGSGKSTVSDYLQTLGADIVDADVIAHTLTTAGGAAIPAIRQAFGAQAIAPDGAMDRNYIRQLVFKDPQQKQALESILHPMIRQAMQEKAMAGNGPYCVMVIPLLIEKPGWQDKIDQLWVVDCSEETQIQRVMRRSHLSKEAVQAIMATQATRAERLTVADEVIVNDHTSLDELHARIDLLHKKQSEHLHS